MRRRLALAALLAAGIAWTLAADGAERGVALLNTALAGVSWALSLRRDRGSGADDWRRGPYRAPPYIDPRQAGGGTPPRRYLAEAKRG
jgi:hypothetical protein